MAKKDIMLTTADLKANISEMEDEKLPLDAPVEVMVEGDSDPYYIEKVGHFHAVPNMTMSLKLKGYQKNNGASAFDLRQLLNLYNFRSMVERREDTDIIRIYVEYPSKYIEFGVNDWGYAADKTEIIDQVINKKILSRTVRSINYDTERNIFCVHLEEIE